MNKFYILFILSITVLVLFTSCGDSPRSIQYEVYGDTAGAIALKYASDSGDKTATGVSLNTFTWVYSRTAKKGDSLFITAYTQGTAATVTVKVYKESYTAAETKIISRDDSLHTDFDEWRTGTAQIICD